MQPLLFRRTGGRALIVAATALRMEAQGGNARIEARSEGGRQLLSRIADDLAPHVIGRSDDHLGLRFKPCDADDEEARAAAPTALDVLRAMTECAQPNDRDEPFALIAVGIVGFDHVDMVERLPARAAGDFPDLLFVVPETLIVIEATGATRVLALAPGSDDVDTANRLHHLAAERLTRTVAICEHARAPIDKGSPVVLATADVDDADFEAIVGRMKQHIAAGDIFQAVPSRSFCAPCDDPAAAFRRLIRADPSAYQYCFETAFGTLFGASPETALEIEWRAGQRFVSVSPIAGTRPRGLSPDEDDRLEADLRLDQKEIAEHLMLVDLARNDIARVARPGTRRVSNLLSVERFARVMHLVSRVEGELPPSHDAVDAIRACLNVGTLSGAPKLRAIELIRSLEPRSRGPYGGAIGWISANGEMDSAVVIRSALVREGAAEVRAGAGIVADSVPASEAAETRAKASAVLAAIGATA